ncbi:hypothetical protein FRB93_006296 [Tulasnella sp. JGI-2019a]|nr:hypothetical protein FRB93_006296 [Tulasnella sp. JGI-2019a]
MLEIFRAIEQSMMPALRTFHIDGARLTLLDHVLQASPLLEDLHLEINTSSRELKLRTHERIRTLVLTNDDLTIHGEIYGGIHSRAQITWRTLPSLVTRCSDNLRILELPLYIKSFTLSDVVPWDLTLPSLTTLTFNHLQIKGADIDPFSKYLAALCPNVKTLKIGHFCEILTMKWSKTGERINGWPRSRWFPDVKKDLFIEKFFGYKAGRLTMEETIDGDMTYGLPILTT